MADLATLGFEVERRNILFKPTTSMPDGTQLGYDGDPNLAINGSSDGQTLIYMSPIGTHYQRASGDMYFKKSMPNSWAIIGGAADSGDRNYLIVNTLSDRDGILADNRSVGMLVFVNETGVVYQLIGGIDNSNWIVFNTTKSVSYEPVTAINPLVLRPLSDTISSIHDIAVVPEHECVFTSDGDIVMAQVDY